MLPQLVKFKEAALDFFFPQLCVNCGKEGVFICNSCAQQITHLQEPFCLRCGIPVSKNPLCEHCRFWQATIDGIRAPFRFEGVIRQAIHALKYRNLTAVTPLLSQMLFTFVHAQSWEFDLIVPVPLHRKRLRERGYNQSRLLAGELGRLCGVTTDFSSLMRTHDNQPQARTQSVEERFRNVDGLFFCKTGIMRDRRVLVVDDVTTTGATLNACAVALKQAGAARVWGLALAKEI